MSRSWAGRLARSLLAPTRIYARDCLALIDAVEVHAMSHITGGGPREQPGEGHSQLMRGADRPYDMAAATNLSTHPTARHDLPI
jgi:hypothetical protein